MRICLLATGDATANPRIAAMARSLRSVGHEVTMVCGGNPSSEDGTGVFRVPTRVPVGGGAVGSLLRRVQPEGLRRRSFHHRLVKRAGALSPELIYATSARVVPLAEAVAEATGAAVVGDPRFDSGDHGIVWLAPTNEALSASPAGPGLSFHSPNDDREPWQPAPGRHAGRKLVIAYRSTPTTPARYLHAALERAGIDVTHVSDTLDWDTVDPDNAAVVIVESPYPALEATGAPKGIPTLLWAHHGEHRTDAHLRLVSRYGVDAVLLAHSWHLAHRYPVPVHRFPFAVATELLDGSVPWDGREFDVGFVGYLPEAADGRYDARVDAIDSLRDALAEGRLAALSDATPEQMAATYANARIVFNEGGTRHHPITMRVLEAVGSGAALLTEEAPGLEQLFIPDEHYRTMRPQDVVSEVTAMLADPATAGMAEAALLHAAGRHTYDHRVDELLSIIDATSPGEAWTPETPLSDVARAISGDVEVSTVAAYGLPDLAEELPLHAVWVDPEPGAGRYDAVALGRDWQGSVADARRDAVRYLYVEPGTPLPPGLLPFQSDTDLTRIDLKTSGDLIEAEDQT